MLDLLDVNFRRLSHVDFIFKVGNIADLCEVHEGLGPWPEEVPNPGEIRTDNLDFAASVQAAANGDRQRIAERDEKRANLEDAVTMVAQHIIMKSKRKKDPSLLLNNGFDQKKKVTRSAAGSKDVTAAPAGLTAKHGPASGTVIVKTRKLAGAGSYEIQISLEPGNEASWQTTGHSIHCSHMEIKGQVPGSKCYIRVRGLGANGPGPWSEPISLIIL